MPENFTSNQKADFAKRGFSRRDFHRMATLLAAGGALPFYNEHALAQRAAGGVTPPDVVKIDANENPMGPCAEAAEAIHAIVGKGGRYLTEENSRMSATLAVQEGLSPSYVQPFAGSSDALHRTVLAFCGKDRPYVVADPCYEAGVRAAQFIGAPVINVPLIKGSFAHDVKRMAAAHPTPGVIYVCNPNNPTGTVTSKENIEWLVNNQPAGSIVLLDEAYIHFTSLAAKASYLVAADKNLIILRTFSKLYGMAGLRAGVAMGRPDLLRRLSQYTSTNFLPITGMVGASASLQSKSVVPGRRKIIAGIREETFAFLAKHGIEFIPSEANMFMMNTKRPGRDFSQAMAREGVYVGRVWLVWPTWVRVTVGTRDDMASFQAGCLKCYGA
jgi:histidinol-phosphate aminotransferase